MSLSSTKRYIDSSALSILSKIWIKFNLLSMCTHKDVDDGHLRAVELVLDLEDLIGELDFRRVGYDEVTLSKAIIFIIIYPIYIEKMAPDCCL